MPEVVFEVELVEGEGGDEGREVRWGVRGTQEGEGEGRAFLGNWLFFCQFLSLFWTGEGDGWGENKQVDFLLAARGAEGVGTEGAEEGRFGGGH